jgi:hypothetical protein
MDASPAAPAPASSWDAKTLIIVVLALLLVVVVVTGSHGFLTRTLDRLGHAIAQFLGWVWSLFGYTSGTLINTGSDVLNDTTKFGLDVADGTFHSVGNLLIASSGHLTPDAQHDIQQANGLHPVHVNQLTAYTPAPHTSLDNTLQHGTPPPPRVVAPDTSANPIQNPIASQKNHWCLVGEYMNRRNCVEIAAGQKCMSQQTFADQATCQAAPPFSTSHAR